MSEPTHDLAHGSPTDDGPVPFEANPQLAANERFIVVMEHLVELKKFKDQYFEKRPNLSGSGQLPSLWEELKNEAGALAAVAGLKSVAYVDAVLSIVDGGTTPGQLTGEGLIKQLELEFGTDLAVPPRLIRAIALAAKDCDSNILVQNGYPAHLIEPAREPGKPRAGSVQLSWAGAKGKGGRRRAKGSGGTVQ